MNTETPIADTNLPAPVITPVLALVNAALDEGDGLLVVVVGEGGRHGCDCNPTPTPAAAT